MVKKVILITLLLINNTFADCINDDCKIDPTNNHVPDFLFKINSACTYETAACQEQILSVNRCIENGETEEQAKENCTIGKKISLNKTFKLQNITTGQFENKLFSAEFLSKILNSTIIEVEPGNYQSTRKVLGYPDITNELSIRKNKDNQYEIIARNYNSAFVFTKINLVLSTDISGQKYLDIKSSTYLKNSVIKKIPFAESIIKSGIHATFEKLEGEIN